MNSKKTLGSLPLEIDTAQYQKLIDELLSKSMRGTIDDRIKFLFVNPHNQFQHDWLKKTYPTDPDLSVGYTFIKDIIDKKLLDDKFIKYVEEYAEKNFQRILDSALEEALTHKAKGMAHKMAKGKLVIKQE